MTKRSLTPEPLQAARVLATLMLAILLLSSFVPARAQAEGRVVMGPVDASQFPQMKFSFEAYDGTGRFSNSLSTTNTQVLEDGTPLPVTKLQQQEPGLQFIVALNATPLLTAQTAGVSIFDQIRAGLAGWAETRAAGGPDDYSVSTNTGLMTIRSDDPAKLIEAIDGYQPNLMQSQQNTVSLTEALDLATDPNPHPQMKRAILYITPPPVQATLELAAVADRARLATGRTRLCVAGGACQSGRKSRGGSLTPAGG